MCTVLIEANCRLHGGEGTWAPMAEACLGYSAVSAMLDAYIDPLAFAAIPTTPINFHAHAKEAKIRSGVAGIVREVDEVALKAIRSLKSYKSEMIGAAAGKRIEKTVDLVRTPPQCCYARRPCFLCSSKKPWSRNGPWQTLQPTVRVCSHLARASAAHILWQREPGQRELG